MPLPVAFIAPWDPDGAGPGEPELLALNSTQLELASYGLRSGSRRVLGSFVSIQGVTRMTSLGDGRVAIPGFFEGFLPASGPAIGRSSLLMVGGTGVVGAVPLPSSGRGYWACEVPPGGLLTPGMYAGFKNRYDLLRMDDTGVNPVPNSTTNQIVTTPAGVLDDGSLVRPVQIAVATPRGLWTSLVARFDGQRWEPLGALDGNRYSIVGPMVVTTDNSVILTVRLGTAVNGNSHWLMRFEPASGSWRPWAEMGTRVPTVMAALPNGDVALGFSNSLSQTEPHPVVVCQNGTAGGVCQPISNQAVGRVMAIQSLSTGDLLVAGDFSTAPGQPRVGLAKFTTRPACLADWDCDGSAGVPDIIAYIAGWFSGSARFDVDGDLRLSTGDIFAFLSAWFAGC